MDTATVTQPYPYWSPENRDDPYTLYAEMRRDAPVHWNGYEWVVTRYTDVLTTFTDSRMSAVRGLLQQIPEDERAESMALVEINQSMMLFSDPPSHTRLRGLVAQAFSAKMIERMRPRIAELVTDLLDTIEGMSEWDIMSTVATPLPGIVICEMLGVPAVDQPWIKRWANDYAAWLGAVGSDVETRQRATRSMSEMGEYVRHEAARRRSEPRDDLLTALVHAEEAGDRLSEQELVSTMLLLLFAGNETTTNLIGNGMLTLLRQREAFEQLRADPSLIRTAVEELLRFESPVQYTSRVVLEPIEIGDERIDAGQFIIPIIGAANRDPEHFSNPDTLDLTRRPNRHIAFAHGLHFCLGAPLARAESQIAIQSMVERFPTLELADAEADWSPNPLFRGLTTLRVG